MTPTARPDQPDRTRPTSIPCGEPARRRADPIEIRVLTSPAELRRLVVLFNQVWGSVTPIVGVELLRAIGHTGGYVAGAFSQNHMVGGSLGFLGRHHGEIALHSHVTGILPGVRQTGLGRQMKLHQRDVGRRTRDSSG